MQLKSILNFVEKIPGFVYEEVRFNPQEKVIEVEIRPRKNGRALCGECGSRAVGYDKLGSRRFDYVPLWQIPVVLIYTMRRVNCRPCGGVRVERVPWARGKSPTCTSYQWFLATWARRMSWSEVASIFATTWGVVSRSVERAVEWGRSHVSLENIKSIGIDEILHRRGSKAHGGPRYLTLVYQIDEGRKRLLWIGKERREETLHEFFNWFGEDRIRQLQFACCDMWPAYLKVIRHRATQVIQILDRFHVAAMFNKIVDRIRADEARELRKQGHDLLTNSRWLFLKRQENLTQGQHEKLAQILRTNLRIVRAYLLKEAFQRFWDFVSPQWAGRFLDTWCERAIRSKIGPMNRLVRSLRKHRPLLLNWFQARAISVGAVEGLNNKAKVTIRKSYGFRSVHITELALYHSLADLPQPNLTHRFC